MAATIIGNLRVMLGLDSATFVSGAAAAEARMNSMTARMRAVGQRMQSVGAQMTFGLTLPLIGIGTAAVRAARESEDASAAVATALESMGDGAGYTQDQLEDMATALSRNSLFGDDDILTSVTANMLTFGNVSGDAFARAQQAALDLSARLGTDLQGSTIMLGKALNDPIQGLSALTRVGVSFTDQQREQIRTMQEAGDMAGAQGVILDELARQYSGQAAALAATDSGQITQAWNQIGEALEAVGKIILPILGDIATFIKDAAVAFQNLSPEWQRFATISGLAVAGGGPLVIGLGLMVAALAPVATAIAAIGWPITLGVVAIGLLTAAIVQNWESIKEWTANIIQAGADMIAGLVQSFQDGVDYVSQKIEDIWTAIKEKISSWVTGFYDLGVNMIAALRQGIQDSVTALFIDMDAVGQTVADNIGRSIGLSSNMTGVGADAAAGVALGVDGQLPWLRETGAAMGDALEQGARDRLDIRSPSQVFADIGRMVTEGLGLGIEGGTSGVRGQMVSLADEMTGATDDLADRMGDRFEQMGSWMVDLARGATTLTETLRNAAQSWAQSMISSGLSDLGGGLKTKFGNAGGGLLSGIMNGLVGMIGANATGTDSWRGGLTRVNEMGGEIMNLPRGTQIIPHDVSMEMARGSGGGTQVVNNYNIDARGSVAGVADQIMAAFRGYDSMMPERVKGIIADPRAV